MRSYKVGAAAEERECNGRLGIDGGHGRKTDGRGRMGSRLLGWSAEEAEVEEGEGKEG